MKSDQSKEIELHGYTVLPDSLIKKNNGQEITAPYIAIVIGSPSGYIYGVRSGDIKDRDNICERALRIALKILEVEAGRATVTSFCTSPEACWNSQPITELLTQLEIPHKVYEWKGVNSKDEAVLLAKQITKPIAHMTGSFTHYVTREWIWFRGRMYHSNALKAMVGRAGVLKWDTSSPDQIHLDIGGHCIELHPLIETSDNPILARQLYARVQQSSIECGFDSEQAQVIWRTASQAYSFDEISLAFAKIFKELHSTGAFSSRQESDSLPLDTLEGTGSVAMKILTRLKAQHDKESDVYVIDTGHEFCWPPRAVPWVNFTYALLEWLVSDDLVGDALRCKLFSRDLGL